MEWLLYLLIYFCNFLKGQCAAVCQDGTPLCDYNGTVSVTSGGRNCRNWTDFFTNDEYLTSWQVDRETLEKSVNFCRNFGLDVTDRRIPWCYTTDPDIYTQECGETICKGTMCGGVIYDAVGSLAYNNSDGIWIYDPFGINFPIDCLWTLTAPHNMFIELNITHLGHEDNGMGFYYLCFADYLKVYETKGSFYSHGIFCANNFSASHIRSNTNTLLVRFRFDRISMSFAADYAHVKQTNCNKDEFLCDDGSCIPDHYRCDGTFADCDGGEDEKDCAPGGDILSTEGTTASSGNRLPVENLWISGLMLFMII